VVPVAPIAVPAIANRPAGGVLAKLPTFTPPPQEEFAIINARAAFDPARQPVAEPSLATAASAAAPPQVTLVGEIMDGSSAVALLLRSSGQTITARTGNTVSGWQIIRIAPGLVVFRAGTADYTVTLRAAAGLAQPPLNNSSPPPSTEKPSQ
jgi:hypothetical protein